jgi:hypothetical protein
MNKNPSDVFLYLLGAGASCETLPLASEFAESLSEFANKLKHADPLMISFAKRLHLSINSIWGESHSRFVEAVEWLAQETSHHASIDTFAKKLYFKKDRDNLKKLKVVLSAYLIAAQQKNHVDLRYDSFFASICKFDEDNHICLPPNLRILTWNYDAQLEKAFYGFCESEKLVLEKITYNRHQIRRINGCCGHEFPNQHDESFSAIWDTAPDSGWEAAIRLYEKYMDIDCQDMPDICFSWEQEQSSSSLLEGLNDVSVIVVIGYSFPYFNREMDDLIFKQFGNNLRKVYLQCPKENYDAVEERLARFLPPLEQKIIRKNSTDLFYIPDEF